MHFTPVAIESIVVQDYFINILVLVYTFSGECAPGPGPNLLLVLPTRSPIEYCGGFLISSSKLPSYMPGPGKLAESDFDALARPMIVYAGADIILPSLLHPNTDGILYSFGAVVSVMFAFSILFV